MNVFTYKFYPTFEKKLTLMFLQVFSKGDGDTLQHVLHSLQQSLPDLLTSASSLDPTVGKTAPRATSFPLNSMCLGCDTN